MPNPEKFEASRSGPEKLVPMASSEIVIDVDGVEVRGVFLWRKTADIQIQITHPFAHLTTGLHIMAQVVRHRRSDGLILDFQTAYGDRCGADLLRKLYNLGRRVEETMETMRAEWPESMAESEGIRSTWPLGEYEEELRKLRQALRRGEADQRELKGLRKRRAAFEQCCSEPILAFFLRHLDLGGALDSNRAIIADLLEGRKQLRA